jgi:hypothetical protein
VYLGAGASGASLGTLDRAGTTVRALEPGVEINSLALGAPDITLEGFTVANLTAVPDTSLRGLTLTSMRTALPLRLSATPRRGVIDLDGAVLDTTTVAILRHTGTVVCKGTTLCVTLEGIDHRVLGGTVRREDAAVVASIDKLTAVFGGAWVHLLPLPPVTATQRPSLMRRHWPRPGTRPSLSTTRTCTTARPGPSSRPISPVGPRRPWSRWCWPTATSSLARTFKMITKSKSVA